MKHYPFWPLLFTSSTVNGQIYALHTTTLRRPPQTFTCRTLYSVLRDHFTKWNMRPTSSEAATIRFPNLLSSQQGPPWIDGQVITNPSACSYNINAGNQILCRDQAQLWAAAPPWIIPQWSSPLLSKDFFHQHFQPIQAASLYRSLIGHQQQPHP